METFSALLALCAGNSPVTGEFPSQRPVTRSFDIFFYLRLNKRLSTQPRRVWFETPSRSLWLHCNVIELLVLGLSLWSISPCHLGLLHRHRGNLVSSMKEWITLSVDANHILRYSIMTSSNGNIFCVTGHLCGEFTGPRWIPRKKASDAELWRFLWSESL